LALPPQQRHRILVAYIVTRPLGASIADWFSKPAKAGALAYGDGPVAAALLMIALFLVTFVAVRHANVMNPGPAESPAWVGEIAE
jgi:uncharacterized membrane-anchored protein